MANYLFPDFLNDAAQYDQAEAEWSRRWKELIRRAGQTSAWQSPWLNTTFANGTPCRDGNPIFSAICPGRRLGVRIIQTDPDEGLDELTYWTDAFAAGQADEVQELVISCALTPQTLSQATELMDQWTRTQTVPISLSGSMRKDRAG